MTAKPTWLKEYFETPETSLPQELVWGVVREAAAPTAAHQRAVGALYIRLSQHLRETGAGEAWLAPLDVVLDVEQNLVVQPDLSVVLTENADIVTDRIWGAPDLVVDVMSPGPRVGLPAEAMVETRTIAKVGKRRGAAGVVRQVRRPRMLAGPSAWRPHRSHQLPGRRHRVEDVRSCRLDPIVGAAGTAAHTARRHLRPDELARDPWRGVP